MHIVALDLVSTSRGQVSAQPTTPGAGAASAGEDGRPPRTPSADRRSRVQSVDRAFALLDVLANQGAALSVQEISTRAGLDRTTTHRLLRTLAGREFVASQGARWALGVGAYRLGREFLDSHPFVTISPPFALDLFRTSAKDRQRLVVVALLVGDGVSIIDRYLSDTAPLSAVLEIGTVLPLDRSATGLSILAHLDRQEIVARLGVERAARVQDLVEETRANEGVACHPSILHDDVQAIAAAVLDRDGRPVGAVNVNGVDLDGELSPTSLLAQNVRRTAERMTTMLRAG